MPGFLVQTITLIGYLSRQVNESPRHIWLATPTHHRVYYSQPGVSRLQQIWFSELAVLCGLGLNGHWNVETYEFYPNMVHSWR